MIITADEYEDIKKVSTGFPNLDYAMGGGFIEGSSNTIIGEPKAGKSSFCMSFAANMQRQKKKVLYVSIEARPHLEYMETLGIKKDKTFSILIPEGPAEEMLDEIEEKIILEDYYALVVDSVAAMLPQDMLKRKYQEGEKIGTLAKVITVMLQRFTPIANKKKMILLLINQLRANMGYPGKHMPGGAAIEYYSSHILYMKEDKQKGGKDFKAITTTVKKSRLNTEGASVLLYKSLSGPFSRWLSAIDYVEVRGLIERKGPMFVFPVGKEEFKGRGKLEFAKQLKEKYKTVEKFVEQVKKHYPEEEAKNEYIELEET